MEDRPPRLLYVDNLRVVVSSLVVLFHLSMTYGAVGGWPYMEERAGFPASYFLNLFSATCQSFFMGMFFLIAAYFTPGALDQKGTPRFLLDRLLRLGIPLAAAYFFLLPLTLYFAGAWKPNHMSLLNVLLCGRGRGVGAMWFLVALACFTAVYTGTRYAFGWRGSVPREKPWALRDSHLALFIVFLSLVTFVVRLDFPITRSIPVVDFLPGHFPQYIVLFVVGIVAAHRQVRDPISLGQAKRWAWCAAAMVVFVFPVLFLLGGAHLGRLDAFMGGANWQSFAFSFWEQCTGMAIIVALLGFAKEKWNTAGKFEKEMAASAYAVYVLHAPVIVAVCVLFRPWRLPPLAKFIALSPVALAASFFVAYLVRRVPYTKRIL